jgi:hypothetical protein
MDGDSRELLTIKVNEVDVPSHAIRFAPGPPPRRVPPKPKRSLDGVIQLALKVSLRPVSVSSSHGSERIVPLTAQANSLEHTKSGSGCRRTLARQRFQQPPPRNSEMTVYPVSRQK